MPDSFRKAGNLLFHYRNIAFPVTLTVLLILWPPVAVGNSFADFLLLIGIVFILTGLAIRVLTIGLAYIVRGGRNRKIYAENLVTDGIFAHCRNPMYVGNILLGIGFLCISGNITGIIVGSVLILITYRLIVHSEECFLSEQFSQGYEEYCTNVPRWLPNIKGLLDTINNFEYEFDWPGVAVKEYGTLFMYLFIPLLLIAWKLYLAGLLAEYQVSIFSLGLLLLSLYAWVRFLKKTERMISIRDSRYKKNH